MTFAVRCICGIRWQFYQSGYHVCDPWQHGCGRRMTVSVMEETCDFSTEAENNNVTCYCGKRWVIPSQLFETDLYCDGKNGCGRLMRFDLQSFVNSKRPISKIEREARKRCSRFRCLCGLNWYHADPGETSSCRGEHGCGRTFKVSMDGQIEFSGIPNGNITCYCGHFWRISSSGIGKEYYCDDSRGCGRSLLLQSDGTFHNSKEPLFVGMLKKRESIERARAQAISNQFQLLDVAFGLCSTAIALESLNQS